MQIQSNACFRNLVWNAETVSHHIQPSPDRQLLYIIEVVNAQFAQTIRPWLYSETPLSIEILHKVVRTQFTTLESRFAEESFHSFLPNICEKIIAKIQIDRLRTRELISTSFCELDIICRDFYDMAYAEEPLKFMLSETDFKEEQNLVLRAAIQAGSCIHYAFYLAKEFEIVLYQSFQVPGKSFTENPIDSLEELGFAKTQTPQKGDLVLFQGENDQGTKVFKHIAVLTENGKVKGKWGSPARSFEHEIFQVPSCYGSEVTFFHKVRAVNPELTPVIQKANRVATIIYELKFAFQEDLIPSILTKKGVLVFFNRSLQTICKRLTHDASLDWDWEGLEKIQPSGMISAQQISRDTLIGALNAWTIHYLPDFLHDQMIP